MDLQFTLESFDSLLFDWKRLQAESEVCPIFSLAEWSRVWYQQFGAGTELFLGAVRYQGRVIGIAPFLRIGNAASFIGSSDVCDYLDFVVAPGQEAVFSQALFSNMVQCGITRLDLKHLRPDSVVLTSMRDMNLPGWNVSCSEEDVLVEMALPVTWEKYFMVLTSKQRHELKRKIRRLAEIGKVDYMIDGDATPSSVVAFLQLFRGSRQDKAAFLTSTMESFFMSVANAMADQGLLRLGILKVDNAAVAATMSFDYKDSVYLYNSGYDPDHGCLSVGLISKVLCIKDGLERGKKKVDFLKGGEAYKYHLGGHAVPLYRCIFTFTG